MRGAARRLRLTAAEFALVVARAGVRMPAGFEPVGGDDLAADRALRDQGVCDEHGAPVPAVLANLRVISAPAVSVRTQATVGPKGLRAVHAVAGPLGASLFTLDDGVELSVFPAVELGVELRRAVPAGDRGVDEVLRRAFGTVSPPTGRLPRAALSEVGEAVALGLDRDQESPAGRFTPEEAALAGQVVRRTRGVLWSLVTGRLGEQVAAGQVVWLATDAGWLGLRPVVGDAGGSGGDLVDLVPVVPGDLPVWLAPDLALILEHAR